MLTFDEYVQGITDGDPAALADFYYLCTLTEDSDADYAIARGVAIVGALSSDDDEAAIGARILIAQSYMRCDVDYEVAADRAVEQCRQTGSIAMRAVRG